MVELHRVSTEELEAELRRRAQTRWREPEPIPLCDECANFVPFTDDPAAMPADYNPCSRKHEMRFKLPGYYLDDNWGFYRRGCKDRQLPENPAPPSRADGPPASPEIVKGPEQ